MLVMLFTTLREFSRSSSQLTSTKSLREREGSVFARLLPLPHLCCCAPPRACRWRCPRRCRYPPPHLGIETPPPDPAQTFRLAVNLFPSLRTGGRKAGRTWRQRRRSSSRTERRTPPAAKKRFSMLKARHHAGEHERTRDPRPATHTHDTHMLLLLLLLRDRAGEQ